ncbi:MAG: OmpA family protein [Betaproteobacteria bacterium]
MQAHSDDTDLPSGVTTRTLPGGFWSAAWPLLAAAAIALLLLRSCLGVTPTTTPPAGFDAEGAATRANERAAAALAVLQPGAPPTAVLAAVNLVVVHFAQGSAEIPSSAEPMLERSGALLLALPGAPRVQIAGHTDNSGAPDANLRLGRARAEAVRVFLLERGFPAARLSVVSYGEARPVADNRTDEGRFRNRRIEFALLP